MSQDRHGTTSVQLADVSVLFRIPTQRIGSFKEYVLQRLARRIHYRDLWALRGVSLDILPGESFGIVGRNGAGKSTLLKVICRVLRPTGGRVVIRGRVAPLLELGAGFHPDLTGRENVVMNATILGHSRAAILEAMDEIIGFSELEGFIDAPIRTFSSGMTARLGFAVATQFRPEVLVLDEVLAVGDVGFQEKCLARIHGFREQGTTILLVSHSLDTIDSHCDRAVWLDQGRIAALGIPSEVLPQYADAMTAGC